MIKLTIPLPPVTKKNSQRIVRNNRTGRYFLKPSIKFEQYQKEAGYYLGVRKIETYPVNIKCVFYMPTRRRVDLTNLLEAIDDILVHYGIIEDDDSKHLAGHDGSRVLYDKENPRTEIEINELWAAELTNAMEFFSPQIGGRVVPDNLKGWKYKEAHNETET
jgi:Holliday junction resolvase RusA-like endonuclease